MLSDLLHHQASHFSLMGESHEMDIYLEGNQQIKRASLWDADGSKILDNSIKLLTITLKNSLSKLLQRSRATKLVIQHKSLRNPT